HDDPPQPTKFQITQPHYITYIWNYHWNFPKGKPVGTISLLGQDGRKFGPWQAFGSPGLNDKPNVNWECSPGITIPAGTYTLVDSDKSTWSWADDTKGRGITRVKGRLSR